LADEPSGNLDSRSADEIALLLRQISSEWNRTVLMVTHDPRIAAHASRIVFLKDGTIVDETRLSDGAVSGRNNGQEQLVRAKLEVAS
ncbi:MAG: lipoprotein-releasing system ATP-binding protein LolD, partial [Anaerolineales bacterium]|nr:lipoprotein-releasing system ATP-binding protein LolD [Anaerolineales bacterium]